MLFKNHTKGEPYVGGRFTVGDLMLKTGLPRARVAYLLETRKILPIDCVGGARIYDKAGFESLLRAVEDMRLRRTAHGFRTTIMA